MATIGHVAVGLAASRLANPSSSPRWPSRLFWVALSLLPDADVVSRSFDISNAQSWGHRGATHSVVFAVIVGAAAAVLARRWGSGRVWLPILGVAVILSHPLLDVLTFGARGCALLWPFDDTRYLAPWRPLAASPIGLGLISQRGLEVMLTETVIFAPVLYLALRRKRANPSKMGGR